MKVDHIILFSDHQGKEANALADFGLTEGSNRVHPGQGTRNRKFYFENFFLEIVWMSNDREIRSDLVAPTRLWERANHPTNGCSPFGLCLARTDDTDALFRGSLTYQPVYSPEGKVFDILTHGAHPYLPWTCRLPEADQKKKMEEPTDHPAGIRKLTKVRFGISAANYQNTFTDLVEHRSNVVFEPADQHWLTLEFDNQVQGHSRKFEMLPLTIAY